MNKLLLSMCAFGVMLLSACSDSQTVVSDYEDSKPTANVSFLVRDAVSGDALDSVVVTRMTKDSLNKKSNAKGYVQFTDVEIGSYIYRVSRNGYATMFFAQDVKNDGSSEAPRVPDLNIDLGLAKVGATVSGRAFYTDMNGNRTVAAGAVVQLALGSIGGSAYWPNPVVSDTADAEGSYSFANLPAGIEYSINVRQIVIDGKVYSSTGEVTVEDVMAGESKKAAALDMSMAGNVLRVNTTNFWGQLIVGVTDSVILTFSEPVDVSLLKLGSIEVEQDGDAILVTTEWKDGNKTLILRPLDGKWWINQAHTITLDLVSEDGVELTGFNENDFTPQEADLAVGQATKLTYSDGDTSLPDFNTNEANLSWTAAPNASGYAIYVKTDADSAFKYDSKSTTNAAVIYRTGLFAEGKSVSFKVVAFNSLGMADVAKAPVLTIKDGIKPELTITSDLPGAAMDFSLSTTLLNNSTSTKADTLPQESFAVVFSEPMDTTLVPAFTVPAGISSKVSFSWEWDINDDGIATSALVSVVVKASQDASTLTGTSSITIGLSTLKDLAGNAATFETNDNKFNFVME